jgi:DnaK suppressor protein
MIDLQHYKTLISDRLKELGVRLHEIDTELGVPKPADWEEQAIDIEDDQVLEGLGLAAQKKVTLLQQGLARISDKSYRICVKCGDPISQDRLNAVLYACLMKIPAFVLNNRHRSAF